jgi:cation diffusion facilitator family transporter
VQKLFNLESFQLQKKVLVFSVFQFCLKILAWYLTTSLAILTDGLESIINIIGSVAGLAALWFAMLPKDKNHPYGHGKIEFLSASFEGFLIAITGVVIFYKSYQSLGTPKPIDQMDIGLVLVAISGSLNYFGGKYCVNRGKIIHSQQLMATGRHLIADAVSTLFMFGGLILLFFTQWWILDNLLAMAFCIFLFITGYGIIRDAVGGILDEADDELLKTVIEHLEAARVDNWVDLHNLRIIKYGSTLHLDCHLTVPWYFNVHEAHAAVELLEMAVKQHFGTSVELFVHTDGCLPYSCAICTKAGCQHRQQAFDHRVIWNLDNISKNSKHNKNVII